MSKSDKRKHLHAASAFGTMAIAAIEFSSIDLNREKRNV